MNTKGFTNQEMKELIEQICNGLPSQLRRNDEPRKQLTTGFFCDACEQQILRGRMIQHLKSAKHKKRQEKWEQQIIDASNED